eukprot:16342632-Heterocapsa_arctica.AAC.1
MTAVVSESVATIMQGGINPPEDGSWPPMLIHSLMTAIGGQRMKAQLTAPAHSLSETMAKNIADGDSAFLHWPRCIGDDHRQTPPTRATSMEPVPDELLESFTAATKLADQLKACEVPSLHDSEAGVSPPDPGEVQRAQQWLIDADRHPAGPIRGVDYVVARAAADANIAPDS